jgi:hypothetical protein
MEEFQKGLKVWMTLLVVQLIYTMTIRQQKDDI